MAIFEMNELRLTQHAGYESLATRWFIYKSILGAPADHWFVALPNGQLVDPRYFSDEPIATLVVSDPQSKPGVVPQVMIGGFSRVHAEIAFKVMDAFSFRM